MGYDNEGRDVRTLLLCKAHGHQRSYQSICHIKENEPDRRSFFTVGDFDALAVYRMDFDEKSDWLEALLQDKQSVFREMSASHNGHVSNVAYHPLHIVANMEGDHAEERRKKIEKFWSPETAEEFPFLMVTFLYGASHPDLNQNYEDALWNYLDQNQDDLCRYAVYNSINLCDLVILWYTKNIIDTLKKTLSVSFQGQAQETYTFVNLLMDKETGTLDERLRSSMEALKTPFPIGIRGSIRDGVEFDRHVYQPLFQGAEGHFPLLSGEKPRDCRISFGENDFSITGWTDGRQFWWLMKYFLENSVYVDDACWNIFTEFQLPYSLEEQAPAPRDKAGNIDPSNILQNVYDRFLDVYPKLSGYMWADAFLELISIHSRIDKLPVLHGPSYLVWGCLHVANLYLGGEGPAPYNENTAWEEMLQESQYSIDRFVREWNQLTAQITKVDDMVFHHLGSTAAIYTTLSEPLLEMYHFFLSIFSSALNSSDLAEGAAKTEPVYSFLLVPTLNQQMRISDMFVVEPETDQNKQVYIIEFPMEFVYKPSQFVVQLAHECMHIFGDSIRRRVSRFQKMIGYLSYEIIGNFPRVSNPDHLAGILSRKFVEETLFLKDSGSRLYLNQVVKILKDIAKNRILTSETFGLLCDAAVSEEEQSIFQNDAIDAWVRLSEDFSWRGKNFERDNNENDASVRPHQGFSWWRKNLGRGENAFLDAKRCSFEEIIDACAYYFKECYADAMAIRFLGITPREYLEAFRSEAVFIDSWDTPQGAQFIQRVAIVLAACFQAGAFSTSSGIPVKEKELLQEIESTLREIYKTSDTTDASGLGEQIMLCFSILKEDDVSRAQSRNYWPPQGSIYYSTLSALGVVEEYLTKALEKLEDYQCALFEDSRELFASVIRDRKFFGKIFYKKIFEYHKDIQDRAQ